MIVTIADLSQTFLRDDRGAAFLITPVSGILQPFCSENIQITAFSDMWGHYTDHLICKVMDTASVIHVAIYYKCL